MTVTLIGTCNRCGLCCRMERDGRWFRCANLLVVAGEIGQPEATWCQVWDRRVDGMPVRVIAEDGGAGMDAYCGKDSPTEVHAILPWLGKGCTLRVAG